MDPQPRWPVPPTEQERLVELASFAVLNTPEEGAYDGLAEIAAALFKTPYAAVSLIDADTQWFKAKIGTEMCETPREASFCAHTILGTRTMVVEDMTCDPRFQSHPFVVGEHHIRFYAGAPIVTSRGESVGTVCVLDVKPRQVESSRLRLLERLARLAVELLEADRQIALLGGARLRLG